MEGLVAELERRLARIEKELARANERIAGLERENRELRRQLEEERRKNKRQAGPFSKGVRKSEPKRPGRKPGSEYGERFSRRAPAKIDRRETVQCPLWCEHCGGKVQLDHAEQQYQTDIPPVEPTTTEFTIQVGRCERCGRQVRGQHREQTSGAAGHVGGVQVGPRTVAAATHLNKNCGMSWRRIAAFFGDLFGLTVSAAGLCRALQRVANRGQPLYEELRAQMHAEPVVSPDETSWRVNGEGAWLHTAAAPGITLYSIARGRGFEEAAYLLGEDYEGILAVDGWAPYRRFPATIQTCLAHLLRRSHELQSTPRPEKSRQWLEGISTVFKRALALRDRREELSEHGFAIAHGRIEAELDRLLDDPPLEDDTLTFAAHLVRERHELFVFLDHRDVPATNHRAEQAIRPAVVNRKMNGGNRTWRGANDQAVVTSLLRTWAQRGRSAIDQCVSLLTAPSLQEALALVR